MLPVLQKKNHCFVACVVSLLADGDITKTQEEIVNLFPAQLQKGLSDKEGIPPGEEDIKTIIIGLGLAHKVDLITSNHDRMMEDLKSGRFVLDKLLLISTSGQKHCWRIEKVMDDGLNVMDPEIGNFRMMDWNEFRSQGRAFIMLS